MKQIYQSRLQKMNNTYKTNHKQIRIILVFAISIGQGPVVNISNQS